MLAYISIILMIAGLYAAFATRNKPRRVVGWLIILSIILQGLAFLVFSGIVHKSLMFTWLLVGLVIGIFWGRSIKFQRHGNSIFYQQNNIFILLYMFLLFINQVMVLLLKVYVPIMLIIAALAAGMSIGHNSTIVAKSKGKAAITTAALVMVVFVIFSVSGNLTAAASPGGDLAGKWTLKSTGIDSSQVPEAYWSSDISFEKSERIKRATDPYINAIYVLDYKEGKYSFERRHPSGSAQVKFNQTQVDGTRVKATYEMGSSVPDVKTIVEAQISGKDVTGKIILYGYTVYSQEGKRNSYPIIVNFKAVRDVPASGTPAATKATEQNNTKPPEPQSASPFTPLPVSENDAGAAVAVSGLLAGISALMGTAAASAGEALSGAASIPITGAGGIPNVPAQSAPAQYVPVQSASAQSVPAESPPTAAPPLPTVADPPIRPPIGTRREDGKIFTKNHGWQNENYPEMNMRSIEGAIQKLESNLQKYAQTGDSLRAEIARDALKLKKRELRAWQEDTSIVKRAQLHREEDFNTMESRVWITRAQEFEIAENIANTVSFAADIALAVATSGASTSLTGASGIMKGLALAKDVLGTGAEALKDYAGGKGIVQITAEQASKRLVSKAVGVEFNKAKILNRIPKKSTSKALKGLWEAAETSAGSLIQKGYDDLGITENFGKGVDKMLGGGETR